MPILPVSDTELAYTAGIIDGEGHLQLRLVNQVSLALRVQVTNTKEELIDWLLLKYGGFKYRHDRKQANHKVVWDWHITENQAAAFLALIQPYVLIKRPQVDLVLEAWANRGVVPRTQRRAGVPADLAAKRLAWVQELKRHTMKGTTSTSRYLKGKS